MEFVICGGTIYLDQQFQKRTGGIRINSDASSWPLYLAVERYPESLFIGGRGKDQFFRHRLRKVIYAPNEEAEGEIRSNDVAIKLSHAVDLLRIKERWTDDLVDSMETSMLLVKEHEVIRPRSFEIGDDLAKSSPFVQRLEVAA
jgi:hypothetical protein